MDEIVRKRILDWIFQNHEHHVGGERAIFNLDLEKGTMEKEEHETPGVLCEGAEYPYVNSLELEAFIKGL